MATPISPRPRLGRGLSALFSTSDPVADSQNGAQSRPSAESATDPIGFSDKGVSKQAERFNTVLVDSVDTNPHQPRRTFDDTSLQELAASLKMNGLIQPIIVRPAGERFELIAGERRLRAARLAGLKELPAIVRDVDRPTQAQWALVENIQREKLNPIDRAVAYQDLLTQLNLTQAELAQRLGEQRSSIANHLRLLDLMPFVRDLVSTGVLTLGHAKVLAGLTDIQEQQRLANLIVSRGLSVRELERLAEKAGDPKVLTAKDMRLSAHLTDLERRLTQHVGLRVSFQKSAAKGKGKVVIHYASLDQFDALLQKLGYSASDMNDSST